MSRDPVLSDAELQSIRADYQKLREQFATDFPIRVPDAPVERTASQFRTDLLELATHADISKPPEFRSHRPLLGPLIVFLKTTFMRCLRPFIRIFWVRQIRMNQLMLGVAYQLVEIENRLKKVEDQRG